MATHDTYASQNAAADQHWANVAKLLGLFVAIGFVAAMF